MTMQIITCDQGSPEWYAARAGIPTASEFKTIVGLKKDAKDKVTRQIYMRKLAGEILTGDPMVNYVSPDMERGKVQEDEARDLYAFMNDVEPVRVGFIRNGNTGCSPDSLLGTDGGLEIKTALAHIQIERIERDELPTEHRLQVQGNLWLAERDWWDFACYCPKLPLFVKRIRRDEACIKELAAAVDQFNDELQEMVARLRRYGKTPAERSAELVNLLQASA
jgi:hypothetical protein